MIYTTYSSATKPHFNIIEYFRWRSEKESLKKTEPNNEKMFIPADSSPRPNLGPI